jgi:hypothetical protein
MNKKKQVLKINIIHGVEKRAMIVFRDEENGINTVMSAQVISVYHGNVIRPCQLPMIPVPYEKHQTAKVKKILIFG